jgi:hypothetical protein
MEFFTVWIGGYDRDNVWSEVTCANIRTNRVYIGTVTTLLEGKSDLAYQA